MTTQVVDAFFAAGAYVYKIPDTFGTGVDRPGGKAQQVRFVLEKPYDLVGCVDGLGFAIEAKFHGKHTGFRLDSVKDHQRESLLHYEKYGGGQAFVLVFVMFELPNRMKLSSEMVDFVTSRGNVAVGLCYPIQDWLALEDAIYETGRLSAKFEELLAADPILIPRTEGSGWDVSNLLLRIRMVS